MREEKKLNKAIRQDGIDTQSEILDELKRRYPQYVEQSDKKQATVKKRRFAFISAVAAAAVCVAIIVPCAVLLPKNNNSGNNGENDNIRYCAQGEYTKQQYEYTIFDYRENNNLNFLYFNWYELGEDCITYCYTSNSNNEVLGLEEQAYLPQSDEFVQLSITKKNVFLEEFDSVLASCQSERTVDNVLVKWGVKGANALCLFEDGGYRYFLQIKQGKDENRLFELVTELFETK